MSKLHALRQVKRELNDIKERSYYEYDRKYSDIYNACVDLDNNYNDIYLCDYIQEQNFVNEDEVEEFLIRENSDSLARLRCFMGDTYDDTLYRINGYGNLENVDNDDLNCLCDELIEQIEDYIDEEKQEVMWGKNGRNFCYLLYERNEKIA